MHRYFFAKSQKRGRLNVFLSDTTKLWVVAEILLFVLVGASVNIDYALKAGVAAIILIFLVLLFRMFGVFICMLKTNLNLKERLFCMIAYLPKATVQAAIGGIPLSMGLNCGETVFNRCGFVNNNHRTVGSIFDRLNI